MKVSFQIDYRTSWGETIKVCGSLPGLGKWDEGKALELRPTSGERWEGYIEVDSVVGEFDYKYLLSSEGQSQWEDGHNRACDLRKSDLDRVYIRDYWRSQSDPANTMYTLSLIHI